MESMADRLPPEIAKMVHPDWRKNEAAYWAARNQLLDQYREQWVAFADGIVIAHGASPVDVLHRSNASVRHPYFTCVGREDQPCRIRRSSFAYDCSYPGEPLPVMSVEFRASAGAQGILLDRVIADTGADATVLPWADCQALNLDPTQGLPGMITGVGGSTVMTLSFQIWVLLDGREWRCRLEADFTETERILGRDVLNQLDVLFRGPLREIVVNP